MVPRLTVLACALGLFACGDDRSPCGSGAGLPDAWTLESDGISVEVRRSPYGLSVRNGDGEVVLESGAAGDGYGGLELADGEVEHDIFISPGYFSFSHQLQDWVASTRAMAARQDGDGALTLTLTAGDRCVEVTHSVRAGALRVEADTEEAPRAFSLGFGSPEDEGFLGFGERFNRTDQRGLTVFSWPEEGGIGTGEGTAESIDNPFPSGETMTYYPVPFFLSTSGYGFWLDTTYRSEFALASERDDAWRVWHTGPTMAFEVYVPSARDADDRPWPYHIIDRFTAATGRPMLPPAWTFGPRRRVSRSYQVEGIPEIEVLRDEDLAITAVDDSLHFYPSAHHIGKELELQSWVSSGTELGYRVNAYYNSFVDRRDDSAMQAWAREGLENGYFLANPDGSYPDVWIITGGDTPPLYLVDFTNPDAVAWYQSSFRWALDLGYSGWMYDFGEYVPSSVRGHDGTPGEALHNLYPVLYAKAIHDALENSSVAGDWLAFMRAGYTGSSAYVPMVWAGDPAASFEESDGLPSMLPAAINLGISGAPNWGGDIGGFHCSADGGEVADEELLTRWIQQGSMAPNMQEQDACVGGGTKASIWTAPAAKEAWRTYARLHTRLFPYLYSLAHRAHDTGEPIIRHVFLEHPDRIDLRAEDQAYYLGPALYVAPVIRRGDTTKTVDLPGGIYLDWSDGELVFGGASVTLDAPLSKLPLLIRQNHLIPLLDPSIDTLADEDHPDVIGPADVAEVYDVAGLVLDRGQASFELWDGTALAATRGSLSEPAPPAGFTEALSEEELATCEGCYLIEGDGQLVRVRISSSSASVVAGSLTLTQSTGRRVRWDLYTADVTPD